MLDLKRYWELTNKPITNRIRTPLAPIPRGPCVTEFPKITRRETVTSIPTRPQQGVHYVVTGKGGETEKGIEIAGSDFIIECHGYELRRTGAGSSSSNVYTFRAQRAWLFGALFATRQRTNAGLQIADACEQVIVSGCAPFDRATVAELEGLPDVPPMSTKYISYAIKIHDQANNVALVDNFLGVVDSYGIFPQEVGGNKAARGPLDIVWCVGLESTRSHLVRSYMGDIVFASCVLHNHHGTTAKEGWRNALTQKIGDRVFMCNCDTLGGGGLGPLGDDPNHAKLPGRLQSDLRLLNTTWTLEGDSIGFERGIVKFLCDGGTIYTSRDHVFAFGYLRDDDIPEYEARPIPEGIVRNTRVYFAPGVKKDLFRGDPKPEGFVIEPSVELLEGLPPNMTINAAQLDGSTPGEDVPDETLPGGDGGGEEPDDDTPAAVTITGIYLADVKAERDPLWEIETSGGVLELNEVNLPPNGLQAVVRFTGKPQRVDVEYDRNLRTEKTWPATFNVSGTKLPAAPGDHTLRAVAYDSDDKPSNEFTATLRVRPKVDTPTKPNAVKLVRLFDAKTNATLAEISTSGEGYTVRTDQYPAGGINGVAEFDAPPKRARVTLDGGKSWREETGAIHFAPAGVKYPPGTVGVGEWRVQSLDPAGPEFVVKIHMIAKPADEPEDTTPGGGGEDPDVASLLARLAAAEKTIADLHVELKAAGGIIDTQAAELQAYKRFAAAVQKAAAEIG